MAGLSSSGRNAKSELVIARFLPSDWKLNDPLISNAGLNGIPPGPVTCRSSRSISIVSTPSLTVPCACRISSIRLTGSVSAAAGIAVAVEVAVEVVVVAAAAAAVLTPNEPAATSPAAAPPNPSA